MSQYSYNEIKTCSSSIYKEKGSKFIAYSYNVYSKEDVKEKLNELKKIEYSARHFCYAYILGPNKDNQRVNDDGEPANSAGKPILGQITSFDLTNTLVIVVRYFGGTKLGVGGLINAYKAASKECLSNSKVIKKHIKDVFKLYFNYDQLNNVMRIQKELDLKIESQSLELDCCITFLVNKNISHIALSKWKGNHKIKVEFQKTI
jgi:uncharacterized YigZ family protein